MNRYTPIISPRATNEIAEICGYIEADSAENAEKVYLAISRSIWSLEYLPRKFRIHENRRGPGLTVHAMTIAPYVVYYRVSDLSMQVDVLSVLHGARRQPRRFR